MEPREPVIVRLGHPLRRIRFALTAFLVAMSLFSIRLFDVQVVQGSHYAKRAEQSRVMNYTLPALRGSFTDTNGVVLVSSVKARDVVADQTEIGDPAKTAVAIAPYVDVPKKELIRRLTGNARFSYVAKRVTMSTWKKIFLVNQLHCGSTQVDRLQPTFSGLSETKVVGWLD